MGRERVPMSSKILSWDKRCTCCATEHPRMSDSALFVCSSFIVTHCNSSFVAAGSVVVLFGGGIVMCVGTPVLE